MSIVASEVNGRSHEIMERARALFPGGVSSPVRAFRGVGGEPFVVERGKGSRIWDADGHEYIDYVLSWGPLILGHAPEVVLDALADVMRRGTSFGIPTELEVELATQIVDRMPHVEMLRFVSSGTEATMSAVRLARAATGREVIIKFDGCYHGHGDSFLVRAGSGVATLGLPNSPGVPEALAALTVVAPFNDLDAVEALMKAHSVAAVIVEPVVGNSGFIAPDPRFHPGLRALCDTYGALLIFDEVMTGFRVAYGGARERFDVVPDLTTLGKVIGGGLPVAVYGGRRDLMAQIAPSGSVYQAGTLSGNPLAMTAGIATLGVLSRPGVWAGIERAAADLESRLRALAVAARIPAHVQRVGTMMTLFFSEAPVTDWTTASRSDTKRFGHVFRALLDHGVYWVPSQYETIFLSSAHGPAELDATERAFRSVFALDYTQG
jgi:glutamate-1-semialdehyde 2,1-aminomutase